jgi:hypothetical protein
MRRSQPESMPFDSFPIEKQATLSYIALTQKEVLIKVRQ